MFFKPPKKYSGFSKIELLVGIAVLAILLLLAVPQFLSYTREAETTKLLNNGKIIESAVARYQITNEEWPKAGVVAITPSIMALDGTMIHQDNPKITGKTFYAVDRARIDRDISRIDTTRFVVDGGGIVYILNPNHIRVIGVRLNPSSLLLRIGETADVNASVEPRNASVNGVLWETSDATIASVDNNGIITAHAVGQVIISAYSLNYLSHEDKITVTVLPAPTAIITMTPNTNINTTTSVTFMHNTESNGVAITGAEWQLNNEAIVTTMPSRTFDVGNHTVRLRVQDANSTWSEWVSATFDVVPLPTALIVIESGISHTLATRQDGTLWAWGANHFGQLGNGSPMSEHSPWRAGLTNVMSASAGGSNYSLAVRRDGTLWAWGRNDFGQLGSGTTANRWLPAQIPLTNVMSISTGDAHSFALRQDGTLWAWGGNGNGRLGDGTVINRLRPVQVPLINVISMSAGGTHSFALRQDGTLWAWGRNTSGQLGDGTITERHSPVQIPLTNVTSISAGSHHSLAIEQDGTLWAWGDNGAGQLGDGTTTARFSPVQIPLTNVASISAGGHHSLAIRQDGTLWAWGRNSSGQLGDGTTIDRHSPVQIPLTNVVSIFAGLQRSFAIRQDGTLWAWGDNTNGTLGNGTTTRSLVPIQILFP